MFSRLDARKDGLYITSRREFLPYEKPLKENTAENIFEFAYNMSFGKLGEHRNHRSGGTFIRKKGEIFVDAFQGKISEFALYNQLYKKYTLNVPDTSTYGLGEWDDCDYVINGKNVSVKSTKRFGQLLLLEVNDWNNEAQYIPNIDKGKANSDIFVLVRISPFCKDILIDMRSLFSDSINKVILREKIISAKWEYDIPGFITNNELRYIIANNYIIQKGDLLNGKTLMDASNYYIQAGDMHAFNSIEVYLQKNT